MKNITSTKAVSVLATALFVGSLIWLMNVNHVNSSLKKGLQEEKLRSESLLSEKLLLEKDLSKLKEELDATRGRSKDLDAAIAAATEKLIRQESEYLRMKRENMSLAEVKRQRQELAALKNSLENELQALRASYATLESKNNELHNTVASLEERNRILSEDLKRQMFASIDQSQIQAVKGKKNRVTVKASRTKKLVANFEVSAALKNVSFKITDPNGNLLTSTDGTLVSNVQPSNQTFTASTESETAYGKLQKVEMIFSPFSKLKSGNYTIEVLNDNLHVNSLKVRLK